MAGSVDPSFEPIFQGSSGPLPKLPFKAAFAAQPGKLFCPRPGNNKPSGFNPAVLNYFRPLKNEGTVASPQLSAESLHADEGGRLVVT